MKNAFLLQQMLVHLPHIATTNVNAFQRTALLLAHDGSENNLVKIQGLPDYNFKGISQNDDDTSDSSSDSEEDDSFSDSEEEKDSE